MADDHSTDHTAALVQAVAATAPFSVRLVRLPVGCTGKKAALTAAEAQARAISTARGPAGGDAPIDVEQLGGSGFRDFAEAQEAARAAGHPWWTLSQLSDPAAVELAVRAAPAAGLD